MKKLIINTDGAARGNPGPAAASFVVADENGQILIEESAYLGVATNNEAEYLAVKNALEKIFNDRTHFLPADVEVRSDSLLVVSQLLGKYKVKNERMRAFYIQIKELQEKIGNVEYSHVPREQNARADSLGNKVLDSVSTTKG